MTINSKKNFGTKYVSNLKPNIMIQQEITKSINNNRLPCKTAFKIAEKLGVPVEQVGKTADLINCKLIGCQLGLFGYKTKNNKTTIPERSAENKLPKDLKEAIKDRLVNEKLRCKDCWDIASRFKISRITVGRLCDSMNIKITGCQLGAF
jgi:hypothetical protein